MELSITKVEESQRKPIPKDDNQLGFGKYFSDHMFLCDFSPDEGWHAPRIVPYGPLQLSPASMVLHYGQEALEGLKAYRCTDGGIRMFRQRQNFERLHRSAKRLCMPEFDIDEMVDACKQLVLLERDWIPKTEGCALYIRPNYIATDPFLGVRPSLNYLFNIIVGPVGAYYPEGFNPVNIYVSDKYVRAVRGGVGEAKTAGNYAASLLAQMEAKKKGFTQVLWLDGIERKYVEEVVAAAEQGTLQEAFGTGTAAIISPVGRFCYEDKEHLVADGHTGTLSLKLYDYILAPQYGKEEDPFGWIERIDL